MTVSQGATAASGTGNIAVVEEQFGAAAATAASDDNIPLQGIPGLFPDRDPTLLPNFYTPTVGDKTVGLYSPQAFVTANPRVDATETAQIGGTATAADTVAITVTSALLLNPVYGTGNGAAGPGSITVTYTVVTNDTVSTVAARLADLINDNASLQNIGFRADVNFGTITFRQGGPAGNFTTLTRTLGGSSATTLTFGNGGKLVGGSGPIIPYGNFTWSTGSGIFPLWYGIPKMVGYDQVTLMVAQGMPII